MRSQINRSQMSWSQMNVVSNKLVSILCTPDVTASVKLILQNIPNKVVYFNIHTDRAGLKPMQPMQLHWAPRHAVG